MECKKEALCGITCTLDNSICTKNFCPEYIDTPPTNADRIQRLTNRKEAEAQQKTYDRRIRQGYPRNIPEERFLRLAAWESLFEASGLTPDELPEAAALLQAKREGRCVVLQDITVGQAKTIMGMSELLNAQKARRGEDQEPLITWQLYNALLKSFTRAEAEVAQEGATHDGD